MNIQTHNRLAKFVKIGNGLKERLHIKTFKTSNDMYAFLAKQDNNEWKVIEDNALTYLKQPYPVKAGVYAAAGGNWHNVKNLDASILAHV